MRRRRCTWYIPYESAPQLLPPEPMHNPMSEGDRRVAFTDIAKIWMRLNARIMGGLPVNSFELKRLLMRTQEILAHIPEVVGRLMQHLVEAYNEVEKSPNPAFRSHFALAGATLYNVMSWCSNAVINLRNIPGHEGADKEIEAFKTWLNWIIDNTQAMRQRMNNENGSLSLAGMFIDLQTAFLTEMHAGMLFDESELPWLHTAT